MSTENGRFTFMPLAVAAAVCAVVIFVYITLNARHSFPSLETGAFAGTVSGLSENGEATLYVERIRNSNAFLFVVFAEGWKPQIVLGDPEPQRGNKPPTFYPLSLKNQQGEQFALYGKGDTGRFSGKVECKENSVGKWSLTPLPHEMLHDEFSRSLSANQLKQWIEFKGRYYRALNEYEALEVSFADRQEKLAKLTKYIAEEEALRERAKARRKEMRKKIKELEQDSQTKADELKRAVSELEQLTRITRRGRAIELARRVAKRENKWYFVNWDKGQDVSSIEQQVAQDSGVDVTKLEASVKRAEEVQNLKNEIEIEKRKILELQQRYREKVDTDRGKRPSERRQQEQDQEKPWWNIFG